MISNKNYSGYLYRVTNFNPNAKKFLIYTFFLALNLGIYGVLFNLYILKLGYKEDMLGLMLSIISVSTGLFAIPAAMICDKVGRKSTLLLSSSIMTASLMFLYTITTREVLLAMSMFYGIAMSFYTVAGAPFMAENSTRDDRMYLFSINSVLYTIATIAGNLVGGILPGVFINIMGIDSLSPLSYRLALYVSLLAVIITFLPIIFIKEDKPRITRLERLSILASAIKSPLVQRLILINSLVGIGAGLIVPFFNVYFHKVLLAKTGEIGIIFSIAEICMVMGLMLVPMLTEKFGKVRTIAMTEIASIPFLIMIAFTTNLYIAAFAYIMRMVLMNMANPAINNFNMEIVEEKWRATVNSLTSMGWNIFLAISTYVSGLMMVNSDYILPYMITCVVYFVAAMLYYIFFLRLEKSMPAVYTPA